VGRAIPGNQFLLIPNPGNEKRGREWTTMIKYVRCAQLSAAKMGYRSGGAGFGFVEEHFLSKYEFFCIVASKCFKVEIEIRACWQAG